MPIIVTKVSFVSIGLAFDSINGIFEVRTKWIINVSLIRHSTNHAVWKYVSDATELYPSINQNAKNARTSIIELTIVEGRNHIVKRIFESMHIDVMKLSRVGYAFLTLDGLKSGEYRQLSIKEIKKLYALKKC